MTITNPGRAEKWWIGTRMRCPTCLTEGILVDADEPTIVEDRPTIPCPTCDGKSIMVPIQ